jgi:magnesium transporter
MTPPHSEERPLRALLAPDLLELLESAPQSIAAETDELHPADLADIVEAFPLDRIALLFQALPKERAADVLEYVDEELRTRLLEELSIAQAAQLVSEMTPDDRADALEELEDARADEILAAIPAEARTETERLLAYEPDTAGGLMTTEFVSLPDTILSEDAIARVRGFARSGRKEALYAIYVTDERGVLRGVMSLRELLAAPDGARLGDVAWEEVETVPASADREEVARVTSEYDLVAVPVVDERGRLLGVVTVDDVIDAMVEEQTEDVQKLGAMQPLEQPYFQASFWSLVRKRGGWLVILFIEEMFTGNALRSYQDVFLTTGALVFFLPLIISSGGNSGSQSATLITRALAVGDVKLRNAFRVLGRELGQGLLLGAFLGIVGFARALMWGNGQSVATIVGLTLMLVVVTGTVVGGMLPLLFTRLRIDPAIASSPFVASLVDIAGIIIYFKIATRVL